MATVDCIAEYTAENEFITFYSSTCALALPGPPSRLSDAVMSTSMLCCRVALAGLPPK